MQHNTTWALEPAVAIRTIYFLSYAGLAVWSGFFYIYLKESNGFSAMQIGAVAAIQQLSMVLVLPVWGLLADRFGRRSMLLLALAGTAGLFWSFYLTSDFWPFLAILVLFTVFYNPIGTLTDSLNLDYVEQHTRRNFGQLRMFASLGYATGSGLAGAFIDADTAYLIFGIGSVVIAATWLVVALLYRPGVASRSMATLNWGSLRHLLTFDRRLTYFYLIAMLFGLFSAPTLGFINLYYRHIGAQYYHIGAAFVVQAVCELPFFFYGKRLSQHLGSKNILLFTLWVASVRMLAYGFTSEPWVAIGIGSLHGITLGLFLVSAVDYVHQFVPAHLRSTGQALLMTFYSGAGVSLGNMLTGYLDQHIGMAHTMQVQAGAMFLLVLLAYRLIKPAAHSPAA